VTRPAVNVPELSKIFLGLLGRVEDGSVQVAVDSVPFASLDARTRTIDLQLAPLLRARRENRSLAPREGPLALWRARKVPGELAHRGWRLTLYDGTDELLALGRGTSALSGHVHTTPAALWKLRKLD
jgi:hypothetical protein